jgi:hypothetical protein
MKAARVSTKPGGFALSSEDTLTSEAEDHLGFYTIWAM